VGLDGMVNVLAHELAEAVANVDVRSGWYTASGLENADLCNRMWGPVNVSGSGGKGRGYVYNMVGQGGMRWLVQLMWDPVTSACVMEHPTEQHPPPAPLQAFSSTSPLAVLASSLAIGLHALPLPAPFLGACLAGEESAWSGKAKKRKF